MDDGQGDSSYSCDAAVTSTCNNLYGNSLQLNTNYIRVTSTHQWWIQGGGLGNLKK